MRARIGAKIKGKAADILAATGLTVSDVFRMKLTRTAAENQLSFDQVVPNGETIEAKQAARRSYTKKMKTPEELLADLHADD